MAMDVSFQVCTRLGVLAFGYGCSFIWQTTSIRTSRFDQKRLYILGQGPFPV